MVTRNGNRVSMTWRELGEALSKAQVLLPDEDITNLTLVKPRALLVSTMRRVIVKPKTNEPND